MLKQQPTLDTTHSNNYQVRPQLHLVKFHFIQSARDNIAEHYDLHLYESAAERWDFIDSLLAGNEYLYQVAERMEDSVHGSNPMQRESEVQN